MGNFIENKTIENKTIDNYVDEYTSLNNEQVKDLKENNYKIIEVAWLNPVLVNSKIFADKYFVNSQKKIIVNDMLDYYLNNKDRFIYKQTEYLCNRKEKICICNTNADAFRKIYSGVDYKKDEKYISWCKKENEPF